jgi:hypothetical protein
MSATHPTATALVARNEWPAWVTIHIRTINAEDTATVTANKIASVAVSKKRPEATVAEVAMIAFAKSWR